MEGNAWVEMDGGREGWIGGMDLRRRGEGWDGMGWDENFVFWSGMVWSDLI